MPPRTSADSTGKGSGAPWRRVPAQVRVFLVSLGLLMASMSLFRLLFLWVNRPLFRPYSLGRVLTSLVLGLRFDLHTLLILLTPFALVLLLPGPIKRLRPVRTLAIWAPAVLFLAAAIIPLINLHYYGEAGRHLAYEIMDMGGNAGDLGASVKMIVRYRYTMMGYALFGVLFTVAWRWLTRRAWGVGQRFGIGSETAWFLACLLFVAAGIRGTLDAKPLRVSHAFSQGDVLLGHLVLNPLYTVGNTLRVGDARIVRHFADEEALRITTALLHQPGVRFLDREYPVWREQSTLGAAAPRPRNLVIIVLEGWAAEHVGAMGAVRSQTPEFDQRAADGLLFTRFVANGRRSVEGMTALLLGLPPYRDVDVQAGALAQNSLLGLARILGQKGYSSLFIHGGKVGTLGLNGFSRVAGFRRYVGMEDLDLGPGEFDGVWGVFDHAMARHLDRELAAMSEPFLALWFTLSSHNPFVVPDDSFRVNPPDAEQAAFLDSLYYSDHSVGLFLDLAAKRDYFADTTFVLVGDHTAGPGLVTLWQRHRVPLLIYAPGNVAPGRDDAVASQMDLLPTLVDLAGVDARHHALGTSLLRQRVPFAIASVGGGYAWFADTAPFVLDDDGLVTVATDVPDAPVSEARAFMQVSKTLLRDNRLAPLPR